MKQERISEIPTVDLRVAYNRDFPQAKDLVDLERTGAKLKHPEGVNRPRTFGIRQRVALFVGAGLTLGAAILAACSGGGTEAKGPNNVTPAPDLTPVPTKTAEPRPTLAPPPSPEPKTPTLSPTPARTQEPTPTATPSPTPEVKAIPPEAQQFLTEIKAIPSITPEQFEATRKGFEERDWPKALSATDDFGKSEPYRNLYGGLGARYNVTKDPAVKAEMDKIEQFIAKTWPVLYQALVDGGAFRK